MRALSIIFLICIGVGTLYYVATHSIATRSIPSLGDFLASTTDTLYPRATDTASSSVMASAAQPASTTHIALHTPTATFRVLVAKNPAARAKGLSDTPRLAADEGMLFIFPEAGSHAFWMKDMDFPIDIIWIDSNKKIVGVSDNISPETYPELIYPPQKVQFVLEVNAGTAKISGLQAGNRVVF